MTAPGTVQIIYNDPAVGTITRTWSSVVDGGGNSIGYSDVFVPTAGTTPDILNQLQTKALAAIQNNINFLALTHPVTNAQAATQIDALTKQSTGVIRLLMNALDSTQGT